MYLPSGSRGFLPFPAAISYLFPIGSGSSPRHYPRHTRYFATRPDSPHPPFLYFLYFLYLFFPFALDPAGEELYFTGKCMLWGSRHLAYVFSGDFPLPCINRGIILGIILGRGLFFSFFPFPLCLPCFMHFSFLFLLFYYCFSFLFPMRHGKFYLYGEIG